jgi:hypothetical protein
MRATPIPQIHSPISKGGASDVGARACDFGPAALVFINNDLDMYHDETDTPARAQTSALNEELGQVRPNWAVMLATRLTLPLPYPPSRFSTSSATRQER